MGKRCSRRAFILVTLAVLVIIIFIIQSYRLINFQIARLTNNAIPKRIHQIWNDDIIPAEFADNVRGLVRDNPHPEWEYYFWTKESGLKFLADKYPGLYRRVMAGADDVMRADIIRIAAIYEYGGVYFDLDTVSVKPLDDYVTTHECSFALEPAEHYIHSNRDFLITNAAVLCRPGHSFFRLLISHLSNLSTKCTYAFDCTGPHMVTQTYKLVKRIRNGEEPLQPIPYNISDVRHTELPALERSEVFQDVYDVKNQTPFVSKTCNTNSTLLSKHHIDICNNWKERGKETRTLSPLALTYHTWFHVYGKHLERKQENKVSRLVPNVKIYGENV